MAKFRLFSIVMFNISMLAGCGKELPELRGIDKKEWIEDRNGCLRKRRSMVKAIQEEKDKLLALDEMQVVALLGKPDHHELYKRNQKFYHYYLHPAEACAGVTDTVALSLVIRFNAMGLAKEVSVQ